MELNDLYSLNAEDTSAHLIPRWNTLWNEPLKCKIFLNKLNFLAYYQQKKLLEKQVKNRSNSINGLQDNTLNCTINSEDTVPLLNSNLNVSYLYNSVICKKVLFWEIYEEFKKRILKITKINVFSKFL